MPKRILVCGSGNTAHVIAGLASANTDAEVVVYSQNREKVQSWAHSREEGDLLVVEAREGHEREVARARLAGVSNDPRCALNCDVIFLALTAFANASYLEQLAPWIEDGAVIVGLPGQGCFEYEVARILPGKSVTLLNFESSPWTCRIEDFGKKVNIFGTKSFLTGAQKKATCRVDFPLDLIQEVIGKETRLIESPSMNAITLMSLNAYSHPPIMYDQWKSWDGLAVPDAPLFYHGTRQETAKLMTGMSDEVLSVARQIMSLYPGHDLSEVIPMLQWDRRSYGHHILDHSTQLSCLLTNPVYEGLTHPGSQNGKGWLPDFSSRYLSEDIPFGLVPIRGISELAGVKTPVIDEVLLWSQEKLGKEFLVDGKLQGSDVASSSCPQRYGFKSLEEIL